MKTYLYIVSIVIAVALKIITARILYRKFGKKHFMYFNISTTVVALVSLSCYIYFYSSAHQFYPLIYVFLFGVVCSNTRAPSN